MNGAIEVQNLSKAYRLYDQRWARLLEWLMPWRGAQHRLKWVLQDITFDVKPGEAVGLIGINGAGKSTLLKLITGTTAATGGSVRLHGRVAAMLELGMGFHPDFTGRQNAIMAGQLLGIDAATMHSLLPQIEAFAEIGDYIDQPVRMYSSGMQMRLAFSVATAQRPDVLIIDEALSVGDTYFQHKSFDRIRQFRHHGTTLLIVSHDKSAIQSICDRAILLDGGRLAKQGSPEEIMDLYNARIAERENQTLRLSEHDSGKTQTVSGTGEAQVARIRLLNSAGEAVEMIDVGVPVTLEVTVRINAPIPRLILGYMIKDRLGQCLYGTNTDLKQMPQNDVVPGENLCYRFAFDANLGAGSYSIATALVSTDTHLVNNYEWRDLALVFTVVNMTRPHFEGSAFLDPTIAIERGT